MTALHIDFIVEQPMSSHLFSYEAMRSALADGAAKAIHFQMAAFNGDSPKPFTGKAKDLTRSSGYTRAMGTAMALAYMKKNKDEILEALGQFGF